MKSNKILALVGVALLTATLCAVAVAQDQATAQEGVKKEREAASTLSKTSDVAPFNDKQGPWVWKDTYVFIQDCDKKVIAAHPIKPEQIGTDFASVKDAKSGKSIFRRAGAREWRTPLLASGRSIPGRSRARRKVRASS